MITLATNVSNATATVATTAATYMANITPILPTNATSNPSCFKMTPYWANMFRPLDDPDYPWLSLWITLPIMGIWYWCTDQVWTVSLSLLKDTFCVDILGSFSNDDGDVSENVTIKSKLIESTTTTMLTSLYISHRFIFLWQHPYIPGLFQTLTEETESCRKFSI